MQGQMRRRRASGTSLNGLKTAETAAERRENEIPLTPEAMDDYLEHLRSAGRVQGTIDNYRRKLGRLYRALPEDDKSIRRDTLPWWREQLTADGYSPAGINQFIIVANGYLEYMGARELQMVERLDAPNTPLPELTRKEYLRLLSAARTLEREQAYLMVKVFGNSDLPVQELKNLTVEAARSGVLSVSYGCSRELVRFPEPICRELLAYAERMGIRSGPIFLTRSGKAVDRTYVAQSIRRLCPTAQVPEEKGSPRCLRKMYRATRSDMEHSIALLVEQARDRLLEEEQLIIGWI